MEQRLMDGYNKEERWPHREGRKKRSFPLFRRTDIKCPQGIIGFLVPVEIFPETVKILHQLIFGEIPGCENDIPVIPVIIIPVQYPAFLFGLDAERCTGKRGWNVEFRQINAALIAKTQDIIHHPAVLIIETDSERTEEMNTRILIHSYQIYALLPEVL